MTPDSIIPKVWSFCNTLNSAIGGENEKMGASYLHRFSASLTGSWFTGLLAL
jgi:hypothetical protein